MLSALMSLWVENEIGKRRRVSLAPVYHAIIVQIDKALQSMPAHGGNLFLFQGVASLRHDARHRARIAKFHHQLAQMRET